MDGPGSVRIGVALGRANPSAWTDLTVAAEQLGYESVWLPEHLVFPVEMSGSPIAGHDDPPMPATTPVFDAFSQLAFLAARTSTIRLGTYVYNLALRHPFASARGAVTVDVLSGGRLLFGVGAGWLREEWVATGLDFASRGRRLDECLDVCHRLFTEEEVDFNGEFFRFPPVSFEPKPVQAGGPPILVGGESEPALGRAVRCGAGWIGMHHSPASAAERIRELSSLCRDRSRDPREIEITVGAGISGPEDVAAFAAAGVHRLVVAPWRRTGDAIAGLAALAGDLALTAT